MLRFRLEFLPAFVKVDFLCAKREGFSALSKCDHFHAEYVCIKLASGSNIFDSEHKVIKMIYLHVVNPQSKANPTNLVRSPRRSIPARFHCDVGWHD